MKKFTALAFAMLVAAAFVLFQGCEDWEDTGSASYNTSRGGGINVNFSGYYRPKSGAFIVESNVTHFVLTQIGNSIEVFDNNGSYYTGTVGTPGMLRPNLTGSAYAPGAEMLQSQVSFSGKNAGTGASVQFVGVVHAVAVQDVQGNSTTVTTTSNQDGVLSGSTNTLGNTSINIVAPPVSIIDTTTTESENSNSSENSVAVANEVTTTYQITGENSRYVLDGNWMEGGIVSGVSAIAPSTRSTFTTTAVAAP